jgi:hypothetical protein
MSRGGRRGTCRKSVGGPGGWRRTGRGANSFSRGKPGATMARPGQPLAEAYHDQEVLGIAKVDDNQARGGNVTAGGPPQRQRTPESGTQGRIAIDG